jgi:hypothetical protein
MTRLGDMLGPVVDSLGIGPNLKTQRAISLWAEVAGSTVSKKSRAIRVSEGILFVSVESAAWAHQLTLFRTRFLKKFAEQLGPGIIRDIHFSPARYVPVVQEDTPKHEEALPVTREDLEVAEKAAGTLAQPRLRRAFSRALIKALQATRRQERAGWPRCTACGIHHPEVMQGQCPFCQQNLVQSTRGMIRRLVMEPWLSADALGTPSPERDAAYRCAKETLKKAWEEEARARFQAGEVSKARNSALGLALLASGKAPGDLTEEDLRRHLAGTLVEIWLSRPRDTGKGRVSN